MTGSPLAFTQSHPAVHLALDWLAYALAGRVYWHARRRAPLAMPRADQALLLGATIFGAALGAIALHVVESWQWTMAAVAHGEHPWAAWFAGKSVLGGLLGGTLGTEAAKRVVGSTASTGDAWVPALAVGLLVGRLGCQLSGAWDMTYGSPTGSAGFGWDYGDGVPRWPVAAMEMVAAAALYAWARSGSATGAAPTPGRAFNRFLAGYCAWRFAIEFLKPPFGDAAPGTIPVDRFAGLTAIQWTALAGLAWMVVRLVRARSLSRGRSTTRPA